MKIDLGDFEIRSYRKSDRASLIKYANNRNVSINLLDSFPFPYTELEADLWLAYAMNQDPEMNFAIANKKELIGAIGLKPQDDVYRYSLELGYWLGEPFWGKGIMTRAVKAFTDYVFENYNAVRIYAGVFESNYASSRVLEKAGYKLEGCLRKNVKKNGKFLNQYIFAVVK